jgi:hypothetical protein
MATASPSTLSSVVIGDSFSVTVSIIPDEFEVISSVTGSLSGTPIEQTIVVTDGISSVTISGRHQNTFTDKFLYTEPGQTDLTVTPNEAIGRGNVPSDKNLFKLTQDLRRSEIRTYNIVVNGNINISVTQEVLNPLEPMRQFMANYRYKGA